MADLYNTVLKLRTKENRLIIGLISGTSADGITAALARISGTGENVKIDLLGYKTYPYEQCVRQWIFELFKPGVSSVKDACEMNVVVGEAFSEAANNLIKDLGVPRETIDLIGSHGQTIWHQPPDSSTSRSSTGSTLQIGDSSVISERTGLPVVSDFRKADMAVGGQGAPLTPYLDYVLHRTPDKNRVLLNIGGIANLTYLPAKARLSDIIAFDTGPGNMIIDALVKRYTGESYDVDGVIADKGEVNTALLANLLKHSYYSVKPPKSTGRETFGEQYSEEIAQRAKELEIVPIDIIATVTWLTIKSIIGSIETFLPSKIDEVYISGGGARNHILFKGLQNGLKASVINYSNLGIPGEAKEALLMALLANEHIMDTSCNIIGVTGAKRNVVLGHCTLI